ncbi:MAG: SDR family oxidoreductase [Actinomycetes bacterium]
MSEKVEYAVVTGASSGIGAATAKLLAANGYHVIAAARRMDRLEALAASNPNIEVRQLDVTDQESVDALAKYLTGKPLTVVVSNAGGSFDGASIMDSDIESWSKTFDVNVLGSVRVIKALTPHLRASGRGIIVILTSTAGHITYETGGSYTAAKHAEKALVQTLRLELNGEPIRVTEIAPGMVKTDEFALNRFAGDTAKAAKIYEGVSEPLTAEDVAEAIRWSIMLPDHFNVDSMTIRPLAQAAQHKVHRVTKN